ncbi:glyoxalase [Paenibacillus swuensis]|uniref:Glyoxalase n=1 Tax=Paenibacillus swuensis TaxID=1178515 RepID=A0A172TKV6_9BACL|nr:VOC family protein [Paenibacillus swuensis]ANE47699.1 glyoxalase [Paenibacillus swuensis]
MIHFEKIHHVSLAVRDLEKARVFYSELLGLREIQRPAFNSRGIWYAIGNQQLHLLEHANGETLRFGAIDTVDGHCAFWVSSYKDTVAWLEQAGIPFEARPQSIAGFTQIYVLDPDHNILEFDAPYESK